MRRMLAVMVFALMGTGGYLVACRPSSPPAADVSPSQPVAAPWSPTTTPRRVVAGDIPSPKATRQSQEKTAKPTKAKPSPKPSHTKKRAKAKPIPRVAHKLPGASAVPVAISIPSIGIVDQSLVAITSVNAEGQLEPPPGKIAWYDGPPSVTPGQPGVGLVLGHSQYNQPDVFWKLNGIKRGARVIVIYNDGFRLQLKIDQVFHEPKGDLQRDARVYNVPGSTAGRPVSVALVTCYIPPGVSHATSFLDNQVAIAVSARQYHQK